MKEYGRVILEKNQVYHFTHSLAKCFICGQPALHKVFGHTAEGRRRKKGLDLCTKHFVQSYKLPPQRHPKKPRTHTVPVLEKTRRFALRQHMDTPYYFEGERLACHDVNMGESQVYFSYYSREAGSSPEQDPYRFVVSMAMVFDKHHAINLVQVCGGGEAVAENGKHLMHTLGNMIDLDQKRILILSMGATKFIEKCHLVAKKNFEVEEAALEMGG